MKKLLFLLFIHCAFFNLLFAQWSVGTNLPEGIRAANTESHIQNGTGYIYMMGGRNDQEIISNKTYRYNLGSNIWETMANVPTPILGSSSAKIGDNIYIIGGLVTTPGTITKNVYKYNIPNNIWTQVADTLNPYTDGDAVAYQDSLIYTVGSYNNEESFVYNIHTNQWKPATAIPSSGSALSYGALSIYGNKLVYVGGSDGTFSPTYYNNVWIGEIDQNNRTNITWTPGATFPGSTRTFFELKPWKNGLILIGGTTDNTFNTFTNENYFYDPQANTWAALTSKPTSWNTGNSASILLNGTWKLFCTGGFQTSYLTNTEIYAEENLSVSDIETDVCHLRNMKTISGRNPKINFCTSENGNISMKIWDAKGSLVRENNKIENSAGSKIISLLDFNLPTGIYFITLSQNGNHQSKKIQIIQ